MTCDWELVEEDLTRLLGLAKDVPSPVSHDGSQGGQILCRQGNAALTPRLCELDESTGALVALSRSGRHI